MSPTNGNDNNNHHQGFWYWMTMAKPANYWLAKSLGGDAEKQAEAAMEDLAPGFVIGLVALVIAGVIWGVGALFGAW